MSTHKKSERPPPPLPYGVDYAPTGRAACKKCSSSISEGSIRFRRKVWSRFHDGYDINFYHLRCGLAFLPEHNISLLNGYQALKWVDVVKLLAKFHIELDENNAKIIEYKQNNERIWQLIPEFLVFKKAILFSFLDTNNYFYKAHKLTPLEAAYRIADGIIFGRMPICPECSTNALIQQGSQIICTGYISNTIHCTYNKSLFSLINPNEVTLFKLEREGPFQLPAEAQQIPIFKKWKIDKDTSSYQNFNKQFEFKGDSGDNVTHETKKRKTVEFDSEDEDQTPKGKELMGVKCSAVCLRDITKKEFVSIIMKHGGEYKDEVDMNTLYLFTSDYQAAKQSKQYQTSKALGVPILHNAYITHLLAKKIIQPSCSLKESLIIIKNYQEDENKTQLPQGIILRQRKYSQFFKFEGQLNQKLLKITEYLKQLQTKEENEKISNQQFQIKYPDINPNSALLKIDSLFTRKNVKIFVDQYNNAFNCSTNFTDIQSGINKFYNLQLITTTKTKRPTYYVFKKWGRIGADNAATNNHKSDSFGYNLDKAKETFTKKFNELTGLSWDKRYNKGQQVGRYSFIELDGYNYTEVKEENDIPRDLHTHKEKKARTDTTLECTLDKPLKDLIELLFDTKMMQKQLEDENLNLKQMPLGSISKNQLKEGYYILQEIQEILTEHTKRSTTHTESSITLRLTKACNQFYTKIPHIFTHTNTPPLIDNFIKLKKKIEMLEQIMDISVAFTLMNEVTQFAKEIHPIDVEYSKLNCKLQALPRHDYQYKIIEKMVKNTHAPTHNDYTLEIVNIFKADKHNPHFDNKIKNRQLLWHGSKLSNWVGILSLGLQVAPPEAPSSGYMFGKGLYFADLVSKSANYCFASPTNQYGILLLCEVSLGNQWVKLEADYEAAEKVAKLGYDSTWGVGQIQPDPKYVQQIYSDEDKEIINIPSGLPIDNDENINLAQNATNLEAKPALLYNEFIVYNLSQVRIKYLIKLQFNFNSLELDEDE